MKSKITSLPLILIALFGSFFVLNNQQVATAAFNQNKLIDTAVFNNSGSMSAAQIDAFLNTFPNSCISPNKGFTSPNPIGYNPSQGYIFGGNVTAGQVISSATQAYGLNPQVILATLQKEQSLITGGAGCYYSTPPILSPCPEGTNPTCMEACQHSGGCVYIALGYGCPHYCDPNSAGFSKQIVKATWMLKFSQQRSEGNVNWNVQKPGWDNSDDPLTYYSGNMTQGLYKRIYTQANPTYFDGYATISGTSVHMDNGATAALYRYTPFLVAGQSFVTKFEQWFGSTQTIIPYAWSYQGQVAYSDPGRTQTFTSIPTVGPGEKLYVKVLAMNMGNQTWSQSTVNIGTSSPKDRESVFEDSSWQNKYRPVSLKEVSVKPGDIGQFEFTLEAPSTNGIYRERFNLVADGITWLNDLGLYFDINVTNTIGATNTTRTGLNSAQILNTNEYLLSPDSQSVLILQKDGNLVFYRNYKPIWYTSTVGKNVSKLVMQSDGNLVLYSNTNAPLWNSGTMGNNGSTLSLNTNGTFSLKNTSTDIWSSGAPHNPDLLSYVNTSIGTTKIYPGQFLQTADRKYKLILQKDGNLVLYSNTNAPLWNSGTNGKNTAFLSVQQDGNLVLYSNTNAPLWNSGTMGKGYSKLVIQQDGNLVLYDSLGRPTWHTK